MYISVRSTDRTSILRDFKAAGDFGKGRSLCISIASTATPATRRASSSCGAHGPRLFLDSRRRSITLHYGGSSSDADSLPPPPDQPFLSLKAARRPDGRRSFHEHLANRPAARTVPRRTLRFVLAGVTVLLRPRLASSCRCSRLSVFFPLLSATSWIAAAAASPRRLSAWIGSPRTPAVYDCLPTMPFKRIEDRDLDMYYVLNPDPQEFLTATHERLPESRPFRPELPVLVFIHAGEFAFETLCAAGASLPEPADRCRYRSWGQRDGVAGADRRPAIDIPIQCLCLRCPISRLDKRRTANATHARELGGMHHRDAGETVSLERTTAPQR